MHEPCEQLQQGLDGLGEPHGPGDGAVPEGSHGCLRNRADRPQGGEPDATAGTPSDSAVLAEN